MNTTAKDCCVHAINGENWSRRQQGFLAIALLLLTFSLYVHFVTANSSDKNWLLVAAGEWLAGKRLYSDIFEINPPLIIWIYAIPVWISQHVRIVNEYKTLALVGAIVIAGVIWLSTHLIAGHPAFAGHRKQQWCFALLLAFIFIFLTPPMYFFDREHILFVLTFPYVLRFMPLLADRKLPLSVRIYVGVLAAIGFCIKPHTLVVFAVLQLLFIARERSLAILTCVENIIIYLLGLSYLLYIVCCLPEYWHTVMPMALATYSAYSRKLSGIYSIVFILVMLGVTFADFRTGYETPFRKGVYYFLGVCGAYVLYGLLNNGWAYTYNPAISMTRFLAGWVLMEFLWLKADAEQRGLDSRKFIFGMRGCAPLLGLNVLFYLICYAVYFMPYDCDESLSCQSTSAFFRAAKQYHARSFGAMSLEFYKWSELARETGERWDTRFNHLWMLPKFLLAGPEFAQKNKWINEYVGNAYAEDLNHWKPEVIFVDDSPEFFKGHANFDIPGYYASVPAFREAWSHYRRADVIDACMNAPKGKPKEDGIQSDCRFDVYSRIPVP